MVHQLLLVGTIPHESYIQTISTLKALTGLRSPQDISTYNLITKPHNVYQPKFEPGKVNHVVQYYMKCITLWADSASQSLDLAKAVLESDEQNIQVERLFVGNSDDRKWTLQIADIPIAGKNQVCSAQNIYESTLVHHHTNVKSQVESQQLTAPKSESNGTDILNSIPNINNDVVMDDLMDLGADITDGQLKKEQDTGVREIINDSFLQFLQDLGYEVINQYWIKGVRFFFGDIIIELFKIFIRDDAKDAENKIVLKLLDESNTFQIKAYKNISKSTDVDSINQGTKDLVKLKETISGLVELEIPDRMYMDSRIS